MTATAHTSWLIGGPAPLTARTDLDIEADRHEEPLHVSTTPSGVHYLEVVRVSGGFEVPSFTVRGNVGKRACPRATLDASKIAWSVGGTSAGNGSRVQIDDASYSRFLGLPQPTEVVASYTLEEERAVSTPLRLVPCAGREGDDAETALPSCPNDIDTFWYDPWRFEEVLGAYELLEAIEKHLERWHDGNEVCLSCPFPDPKRLELSERAAETLLQIEALLAESLSDARAMLPELLAEAEEGLERSERDLVGTAAALALGHAERFTAALPETASVQELLHGAEIEVAPETVAVAALSGYLNAYPADGHPASPTAAAASGAAAWLAVLERTR